MGVLKLFQDSRGAGTCRSCGAAIEWAELTSGKRHPFNAPIVVVRTQADFAGGRTIEEVEQAGSHFATCPQAKTWSRK